jgi:hypothetical protein
MKLHFVMPPDGLSENQIEGLFNPQAKTLIERGHTVSIVKDEVFNSTAVPRNLPRESTVVYRGWMVGIEQYKKYEEAINAIGSRTITNSSQYCLAHWLPNWYSKLSAYTAETVVVDKSANIINELKQLNWKEGYFLKDYVKSLKVAGGSIVRNPEDGARWLKEMLSYRDEIEGGICIRRIENFIPDSELRYFVIQGKPFGPNNSPVPEPVNVAASTIESPFFSVDVAKTIDGDWRIVELGDGQVSDLVGWTAEDFAKIWDDSC